MSRIIYHNKSKSAWIRKSVFRGRDQQKTAELTSCRCNPFRRKERDSKCGALAGRPLEIEIQFVPQPQLFVSSAFSRKKIAPSGVSEKVGAGLKNCFPRPAPTKKNGRTDVLPRNLRKRREREMNLQFKSIYIRILQILPNQNTPNRPHPICIVLPCVALGQYKDTNFIAKIKFAFISKAHMNN